MITRETIIPQVIKISILAVFHILIAEVLQSTYDKEKGTDDRTASRCDAT